MKVAHEAFEIMLENNFGDTYMDIEYDQLRQGDGTARYVNESDIKKDLKAIQRKTELIFAKKERDKEDQQGKEPPKVDMPKYFLVNSEQDPNFFLTMKKQTVRRAADQEQKRLRQTQTVLNNSRNGPLQDAT